MQKFYITAILLIALTIQLSAQAQDVAPFEGNTPSEQTVEALANDLPSESFRPGTRARPGDIGDNENAQKTPLGDMTFLGLLGLCGIVLSYGCYKQTNFSKKRKI